ncbi:MAG: ribosome silencing factor [Flavobacteriaceae bacterium]|jgi:ribosome-associated protein|nr:ribosome silencing factor [Flavobacteriaceae bacterium]|tara:strand:+ start:172 stop:495 length:324 start_codon:yes stop_codon:yes gene_type:complete
MKKTSRNLIVRSLEDLKAIDTQILDLTGINSFTDHLIITTGTSSPHISAISKKLYGELKKNKIPVYGFEGKGSKEWVLLDLGEIVINIMSSSARELYDLESLWDPSL